MTIDLALRIFLKTKMREPVIKYLEETGSRIQDELEFDLARQLGVA